MADVTGPSEAKTVNSDRESHRRAIEMARERARSSDALSWREMAGVRRSRRRQRVARLSRRMLAAVAAVALTSVAGWGGWMLTAGDIDAARLTNLSRVSRSLADTFATMAAPAIADEAKLRALCDAIASTPLVADVGFSDAAGKPLLRSAAHELSGGTGPRTAAPVVVDGQTVGELWLTVDAQQVPFVHPGERAVLGITLASAGVMTVIATLVGSWIVRRRLVPLRRLTRALRWSDADGPDASLPIRLDELEQLELENGDVQQVGRAIRVLAERVEAGRRALGAADERSRGEIAALRQALEDQAKQLSTANERLSGEIAEKEDFVRAVSHDLNAPLRNVAGMVTMLLTKSRETLGEDVVRRLERIKANVDVEASLIDELLEFSRIKTRRQTMNVVEVEKVVWELRGIFENDLKTRGIELIVDTALPNLFADRSRVRQVFQNLIDNAIKYMGDERPTKEIRVGCRVSVSEAEFYVSDTGVGIAPADQDKVFHIFRRGTSEQTQKTAGKGVGLASVKSIIETYAGKIWVESQAGRGTTFRFTINGQYVPTVSGKLPTEMAGQPTSVAPSLAAAPRAA